MGKLFWLVQIAEAYEDTLANLQGNVPVFLQKKLTEALNSAAALRQAIQAGPQKDDYGN